MTTDQPKPSLAALVMLVIGIFIAALVIIMLYLITNKDLFKAAAAASPLFAIGLFLLVNILIHIVREKKKKNHDG